MAMEEHIRLSAFDWLSGSDRADKAAVYSISFQTQIFVVQAVYFFHHMSCELFSKAVFGDYLLRIFLLSTTSGSFENLVKRISVSSHSLVLWGLSAV